MNGTCSAPSAIALARPVRVAAAMLVALLSYAAGGASAQSEHAGCRLVRIAEWHVRVVDNKILVDGAINGQKVGVAIDTGATITILLRATAKRLGLPLREVYGRKMYGVGGETRMQSTRIAEITIGDATVKGMTLFVAGERDFGDTVDVILGEDFFYKLDVEFDLAHDAVRLFESRGCEGVSLAYWASDGGSSVEIESVAERQPRIVFPVEINGVVVDAVLDSGASLSLLDAGRARLAGVTPDTPGVKSGGHVGGLGAKSVETWVGTFDTVVIGNERIRGAPLRFADFGRDTRYSVAGSNVMRQASDANSLLLGADFIRAHRVLVSHTKRRMYFTYVGGPAFGAVDAGGRSAPERSNAPAESAQPPATK